MIKIFLFLFIINNCFGAEIDFHLTKTYELSNTAKDGKPNVKIGPGYFYNEKEFKKLLIEIATKDERIKSAENKIVFLENKISFFKWKEKEKEKLKLKFSELEKEKKEIFLEKEKVRIEVVELYKDTLGIKEKQNKLLRRKNDILRISLNVVGIASFFLK